MKDRIAMCKADASYASRSFKPKPRIRLGGTTDAAGMETEVNGIARARAYKEH
jgi:hypothetical protein